MVRGEGVEPSWVAPLPPQSSVSTNSTTPAQSFFSRLRSLTARIGLRGILGRLLAASLGFALSGAALGPLAGLRHVAENVLNVLLLFRSDRSILL